MNFSGFTAWIPNPQSLRKLSAALIDYDRTITSSPNDAAPLENYPDSDLFTRSLQSRPFQHGPNLGQTNLCFVVDGKGKDWKNFHVAENRAVRCYQPPGDSPWKCIPMGTAWTQFSSASTELVIQDFYRTRATPSANENGQQSNGNISVSISSATESLQIDDSIFQSMIVRNTFDWNAAFRNVSLPPNTTLQDPQQIFEYRRNVPLLGTGNTTLNNFIYCDLQTRLGFADYAISLSQASNPINMVDVIPILDRQKIYVHLG